MRLNIVLGAILVLLISGCTTTSNKVINKKQVHLPVAQLPEWSPGDRITYGNGRSERVIKVKANQVFWKKTKTTKFTTSHNFIEPQAHYESKTRIIDKKVINFGGSDDPSELWPLKVNNTVSMYYNNAYANLKVGDYFKKSMRHRECRVDDTATVRVLAGEFDTYVVNCYNISINSGNKGTQYSYYYAPSLGHWVLKITKTKKNQYEKELMRLNRGVKWLSKKERKSLENSLQSVMEYNQTGQKNIWKSIDGTTTVESYPSKTMKLETGVFCRNYVQVITTNKVTRSVGLLCRNNDKKWRTPKREKVVNLGFKGFF